MYEDNLFVEIESPYALMRMILTQGVYRCTWETVLVTEILSLLQKTRPEAVIIQALRKRILLCQLLK